MLSLWTLLIFTLAEIVLLGGVLFFFLRLRRSEALMTQLQSNQEQLLERLQRNAELEHDLVATFAQRQAELRTLDQRLEERAVEQAEGILRSPQFLRELILNKRRQGQTAQQIARAAGLAVDEVELILAQSGEE